MTLTERARMDAAASRPKMKRIQTPATTLARRRPPILARGGDEAVRREQLRVGEVVVRVHHLPWTTRP